MLFTRQIIPGFWIIGITGCGSVKLIVGSGGVTMLTISGRITTGAPIGTKKIVE